MENYEEDPNPYGFLQSLQEGREWLEQLENELTHLVDDLLRVGPYLSEVGEATLKYAIVKTEDAIQRIELEMKMFDE